MPSIIEQCDEFFGTKNLYELFKVKKNAVEKDITKAYYKLALKVHPDRVPEEEKEVATEKFKVLAKLHQVLTTKDKRALYDEQGVVGDDDGEAFGTWYQSFKPIFDEDINNYKRQYIGSEMEKIDIKKTYLNGKGCIDFMFTMVPFMTIESEPRIMEIVKKMIAAKEVPEYKLFTQEPKAKTDKRHKKYKREEKEAAKVNAQMAEADSFEQLMMRRQNDLRSFVNKYSAINDSEIHEFSPTKHSRAAKVFPNEDDSESPSPPTKRYKFQID